MDEVSNLRAALSREALAHAEELNGRTRDHRNVEDALRRKCEDAQSDSRRLSEDLENTKNKLRLGTCFNFTSNTMISTCLHPTTITMPIIRALNHPQPKHLALPTALTPSPPCYAITPQLSGIAS